MKNLVFFSFVTLFLLNPAITYASEYEMNGIRLEQYKDFEKNWQFVTVRYREDTGEMRFTFANPKAWAHLTGKDQKNYPEGSVFAKVSVRTIKDVAFPSSAVPSGKRRIQFMVRDNKKYASTGGWGYALFGVDGTKFQGDVPSKTMACYACHKIVSDKGDVFSQPMSFLTLGPQQRITEQHWFDRVMFKVVQTSSQKSLSSHVSEKKINLIDGPLEENLFFGTLDEIRPLLIEKTLETKRPSALVSKDGIQFSIVQIDKKSKCDNGKIAIKSLHTTPNEKKPLLELNICWGKR